MTKRSLSAAVAFLMMLPAFGFTANSVKRLNLESSALKASGVAQDGLPKMSTAVPFLERPKFLTGELAGDVGFDPLGFATNPELLIEYREAEIKHARLAMLAAAGWPVSELYDKKIAAYLGMEPVLDAADRVPSVLNGGMDKISPVWWGFCVGLTAAIDLYGVRRARSARPDPGYFPGNLGFDPLGFYPSDKEGQKNMQLAEIKHGRTAMMAVLAFVLQEAISREGVVDETPLFFYPLSQTLRSMLENIVN